MLDKKYLRDNAEEAVARLTLRGAQFEAPVRRFVELDLERRNVQTELDELKSRRNGLSKQVGELMKAGQRDEADEIKGQSKELGDQIDILEGSFAKLDGEERELLLGLPNLPHPGIPVGGEDQAVVVSEWGDALSPQEWMLDQFELGNRLGLFNFEAGVRVTGAGFPFLTGAGAMLQRALINFMLDVHIREHGYTEVRPPFIVNQHAPLGTGQLPKFGEQMYHVHVWDPDKPGTPGEPDFYLIPTAEVPVANMYRELILDQPALPLKLVAYSPCFRVEAGSYGADVRGLKRLHQFEKVELVRISDPEKSWDDHEEMTLEAEGILKRLEIPFRRKVLPTGDMAFGSAKTYDVELYAPLSGWLEVSSASNTTDWQSRRANLRIRKEAGGKPEFAHLLNASGLALPRLMIAVLEQYQQEDGSVTVPEPLRNYMGGLERITAPVAGLPQI